jgi:hypothetical protein
MPLKTQERASAESKPDPLISRRVSAPAGTLSEGSTDSILGASRTIIDRPVSIQSTPFGEISNMVTEPAAGMNIKLLAVGHTVLVLALLLLDFTNVVAMACSPPTLQDAKPSVHPLPKNPVPLNSIS